jgi:hypothetical protein
LEFKRSFGETTMRLLRWITLVSLLCVTVAACGPARKSVYPPTVTIQQLSVLANGQWQVTMRIQNSSYGEMDFTSIEGRLQIAQLVPVRLHANFERAIPALNGDVVQIQILPTTAMTQLEQTVATKGRAGTLAYRISGSAIATPEQEHQPRSFDFDGNAWISPVPGIAHTWR